MWTSTKPDGKAPCVFISATKWLKNWTYAAWEIKRVDGPEGWYWGLCDGDGDEWGDLEDLKADLYLILPDHPNFINGNKNTPTYDTCNKRILFMGK